MVSNQIIQTSIDELKGITKVDFAVFDLYGDTVAATFDVTELNQGVLTGFTESPAESQVIGHHHLLKIYDEEEVQFICDARGLGDDAYTMGKVAVCQIQNLIIAYKERFDRNNFFQNLILDNMLLVDIYNRAKRLHITDAQYRVVYLIETISSKDSMVDELMKGLFSSHNGDYIVTVDENTVVLIKAVKEKVSMEELEQTARVIIDMLSAEAMVNVRVAFGGCAKELKDVSKSYKEAKMAAEVGKIFYPERKLIAYHQLGIGRLIYQLPVNLCKMFIDEIFGGTFPDALDEETQITVDKFFENNLNVSETARHLFIHRNTLVYRMEKLQKTTGLDIRVFEDALTLKIALMVLNYMKHLEEERR